MPIPVKNTIYVGHLQFNTKQEELEKLFAEFGEITKIHLPTERDSDRELGYALIEFKEEKAASTAIEKMNGFEFNGRQLKVNIHTQQRCRGRW